MNDIRLDVSTLYRESGIAIEPTYPDALPRSAVDTVLARDHHTCRFCGFRSEKYQQAITVDDCRRDIDNTLTACIFCQQCFEVDRAFAMRSGIVIWLPSLSQSMLSHLARDLYRARITQGSHADRAKRVLDLLIGKDAEPRSEARRRLGSDQPDELARMIREDGALRAALRPGGDLDGLRLYPLDRRIHREGDLEFNQFPQILAFYRSRNGPLQDRSAYPWLDRAEEILFGIRTTPTEEKATGVPCHVLAARLLRDAATFFARMAEDNPKIESGMNESVTVFREVADLVEADPLGTLGSATTAEGDRDNDSNDRHHHQIAARLLRDAAQYFRHLGEQNPALATQMTENADVFEKLATTVAEDPERLIG